MKSNGDVMEFGEKRTVEIERICRQLVARGAACSVREIVEKAVLMPASQFWVSCERAAEVIRAIDNGVDVLSDMRPNKREMFIELYRRFCLVRDTDPSVPFADIISSIIYSPAPKFYMSPRTAMGYINSRRKRIRDERRENNQ